ncbi:MAG: oligosaccharide flippase family protein [Anaerolineae bacterium]|nr:oligosaccharide flippase family protein [Anaerolineae bacterium]
MSQLAKDITITLIGRILYIGLALITNIIIARYLGPTLQGTYQVIILVMSISNLIFGLGLNSSNIFIGARHPDKLPFMVGNSLLASVILGLVAILIVELLTLWIPFYHYLTNVGVPIRLMQLVLFLLPAMLLWNYLKEIIHAVGWILIYNLLSLALIVTQLVLIIVFSAYQQDALQNVIFAWVISYIFITIITIYFALRAVNFRVGISRSIFNESISFALKNHIGVVTQFLNYRADIFIIGFFYPPAYVGFYGIATLYAERMWEIPTSIRTALMFHAASDEEHAAVMTARVTRVVAFLIGISCLILAIVSYPFISFAYSKEYLPAVPALLYLLPGVWFFSIGKLLAVYIATENHPEIGSITGFIALIATIILDLLLIPSMGIKGAAIASSVSYTLSSVIILFVFVRMSGIAITEILVLKRRDLIFLNRIFTRFTNALHRKPAPK